MKTPEMKTTVQRVAGKLVHAVHEMNEAQRLMLALRTATDRYAGNPGTYEEFLARTSGALMHEPSARRRLRKGRFASGPAPAPTSRPTGTSPRWNRPR